MSAIKAHAPQPPLNLSRLTPIAIFEEVEEILRISTAFQDRLVDTISLSTANFANLVRPLIDNANRIECRLKILGTLLLAVSPNAALREASRQAQKLILAAKTSWLMREDVAALLFAVNERSDACHRGSESDLDSEDRYLLHRMYNEYKQSGAAVTDHWKRTRLQDVRKELSETCLAVQKTLTDVDDGIWFSRFELAGLPKTVLNTLKTTQAHNSNQKYDQLWVPFRSTALLHLMRDAEMVKTRRTYHVASTRRFPENLDRLQNIVTLRQEAAELLGFENHASVKMAEKMAKGVSEVKSLLEEIRMRLDSVAKKEIQRLLLYKRKNDIQLDNDFVFLKTDNPSILYAWDWGFYANQLRQDSYSIDAPKLSEYFEARHTFDRMLEILETLFGLEFVRTETRAWHESVTVYAAWDGPEEGGGFLGYLYVDLFIRDGKFRNAQHIAMKRAFVEADGTRNFPCSVLLLSHPTPKPDRPTLLLMTQVRTMFHELGHAIHNLCAATKYGIPHSRDFVEIPSLMLEHWIWDSNVLMAIGKHYTCLDGYQSVETTCHDLNSGTIPRDLVKSIIETKTLNKAHEMLGEVQRALFDLAIHTPSNITAAKEMNTTVLWNKMRQDIIGLSLGDNLDEFTGFDQASFGHIFRNYDAGFFAYPLSKVYAADLYSSIFASDPLNKAIARRYRNDFLKLGSSQSEMKTLEDFLGRKPDAESFFSEIESAWHNKCS
ncbi:peptidase family M3 [Phlyctema vagabunda]|uniref:Peptidase family M3 n=1 Tax=Phlyctema vagabunda TaxID=108571 RepID=A0ABR4PY24_9HELO